MLGWTIHPTKLRELREQCQLTPAEMAERVGCHPNTWHNLERGQQPSAKLTWRIVNHLSATLNRSVTVADIATPREHTRRKTAKQETAAEGSAA